MQLMPQILAQTLADISPVSGKIYRFVVLGHMLAAPVLFTGYGGHTPFSTG